MECTQGAFALAERIHSVESFLSRGLGLSNGLKSACQAFGYRSSSFQDQQPPGIRFHNIELRYAATVKYTGMYFDMDHSLLFRSFLTNLCRKLHVACGTSFLFHLVSAFHPPDYAINYYKARIQPILQYGAELVFDTALHLQKLIVHAIETFLRHQFFLSHNSMAAPLYLLSGLFDLCHLWRNCTWSSIQSISCLPAGHPAKLS